MRYLCRDKGQIQRVTSAWSNYKRGVHRLGVCVPARCAQSAASVDPGESVDEDGDGCAGKGDGQERQGEDPVHRFSSRGLGVWNGVLLASMNHRTDELEERDKPDRRGAYECWPAIGAGRWSQQLAPRSAPAGLAAVGQSQYEHQQPNLEDLVDHPIVTSAHPALSGAQSTRPGSLAGSKRLDSLHHLKPPRGHRGGGGNIRSYPTASAPVRGDSGAA